MIVSVPVRSVTRQQLTGASVERNRNRGEVDTAVARGRKQGSVFIAQEEIMELPGSAYLYTLATLSMTFAGFSAVVIVLCQTIGREISGFHVVLMRLYIEAGL
jgi:hypothetical protein